MVVYRLILSLLIITASFCYSNEQSSSLVLKGFLGKEELSKAKRSLENLEESNQNTLIMTINSTSGDLTQVLDVAKSIYQLKILKGLKVIAYIDGNAIGPAAILPFLADELYVSLFVSWGDIPLGTEGIVPTNILRNRVSSLISENNPQSPLLTLMADAMSDPSIQIIDDNGWKKAKKDSFSSITQVGQTLVVNQNQLKQLGLIKGSMLLDQFNKLFQQSFQEVVKTSLTPETTEISSTAVSNATLEQKLKKFIHYNQKGSNEIGYIAIDDRSSSINQSTWLYVKQALDHYKKTKPLFIILELNTPGGEVFAAQKISDALKDIDTQYNIPVVAFINNWAISAGAMIAYSCRFITVVKDASMGAAEPVYATQEGQMVAASEKVNSAIRTDFANRARFFDRNPFIAEAMVDKDLILVMRNQKIIKLDSENQIRTTGPNPDIVISPKGKLLTLSGDQLLDYGVADMLLLPEKLQAITDQQRASGEWLGSQMLLFRAPFFKDIPEAKIKEYQMDWKTQFFVFLANPVVASLLFMGLLVGAYVEINTPGFGFPGSAAALCLFLIVLSSFSLEVANWLELILLLAGVLILLLELFVLPTGGFLGVVGVVFFLIGLFGLMLPGIGSVSFEYDTKTLNAAGEYFIYRLALLCVSLIISVIAIVLLARYALPSFAGFSRLVLKGHEQVGYTAVESSVAFPQPGAKGAVLATLRPTGKVMIEDTVYDAITRGGFIESGTPIIVVGLESNLLIVTGGSQT